MCRLDHQKNRKIFDWEKHHKHYIDEWVLWHDNVDDNNLPHMDHEYRRYQAWYQGATRCRLRLQWTEDDYADIESSDDEDTVCDQTTHVGRQVKAGLILDRVVSQLPNFSMFNCIPIQSYWELCCRATPSNARLKTLSAFIQELGTTTRVAS